MFALRIQNKVISIAFNMMHCRVKNNISLKEEAVSLLCGSFKSKCVLILAAFIHSRMYVKSIFLINQLLDFKVNVVHVLL